MRTAVHNDPTCYTWGHQVTRKCDSDNRRKWMEWRLCTINQKGRGHNCGSLRPQSWNSAWKLAPTDLSVRAWVCFSNPLDNVVGWTFSNHNIVSAVVTPNVNNIHNRHRCLQHPMILLLVVHPLEGVVPNLLGIFSGWPRARIGMTTSWQHRWYDWAKKGPRG